MNYYEILGIDSTASMDEIKKSYKKLAVQWHPDKNKNEEAEEIFKKINEAYSVLSNETKKKEYDKSINKSFFSTFAENSGINNMMNHFFNNKEYNIFNINLTLDEFYTGTEKNININLDRKCEKCKGYGYLSNGRNICSICNGNKYIIKDNYKYNCNNCNSKGFTIKKGYECNDCNMIGLYKKNISFKINIPKGNIDGKQIILKNKGNYSKILNNNIDLKFIFREIKHKQYKRINNNLYTTIDIPLWRALCKNIYELNFLNNEIININIDKIIKPNYIMKIDKYGMPLVYNNNLLYGDLLIKFNIIFPDNINDNQENIIKDMFDVNYIKPNVKNLKNVYITNYINNLSKEEKLLFI